MADEIIELLKNEKLRVEVIRTIENVYALADTAYKNPDKEMQEAITEQGTSLWEEAWCRAENGADSERRMTQAFQEYVIQKMSRPARITLDDLSNGFVLLANPTEYPAKKPDWENAYAVFRNFVEHALLSRKRSSAFEICRCPTLHRRLEWYFAGEEVGKAQTEVERADALVCLEKILKDRLIWSSKNGIRVRCVGDREIEGWYHVLAEFCGPMSRVTFETLQSEMPRLVMSIIRSVSLLEPCEEALAEILTMSGSHLPSLHERTLVRQKVFIHSCLDAFYSRSTKKDSIDNRIRNAVHLLMEADSQSNDALGLALSVTAMEALLGMGSTEISERLSTDVAVLLEPELGKRHGATEFVKRLYAARSDALHGKSLEKGERVREQARLLAAGILRAMVTRREFMQKSGCAPETPHDLLKELRTERFRAGQIVGVDEPNVRKLWGGS